MSICSIEQVAEHANSSFWFQLYVMKDKEFVKNILERAKKHKIPSYYISHKNINRETFDKKVTSVLKEYKVDLVLLIGFMRILSFEF